MNRERESADRHARLRHDEVVHLRAEDTTTMMTTTMPESITRIIRGSTRHTIKITSARSFARSARTCSDSDVSADNCPDAVDGRALVNGPVDILPEGLGLEDGKIYRTVTQDMPYAEDARYTAAVRPQPVDGRQRISAYCAIHPAAVHVGELHPGRRLRYKTGPLRFVRGAGGTCCKGRERGQICINGCKEKRESRLTTFN